MVRGAITFGVFFWCVVYSRRERRFAVGAAGAGFTHCSEMGKCHPIRRCLGPLHAWKIGVGSIKTHLSTSLFSGSIAFAGCFFSAGSKQHRLSFLQTVHLPTLLGQAWCQWGEKGCQREKGFGHPGRKN